MPHSSVEKVSYKVCFTGSLFRVLMQFHADSERASLVRIAHYIPGSYTLRDIPSRVSLVRAKSVSTRQNLIVKRADLLTWSIEPTSGPVEIEYEVFSAGSQEAIRGAFISRSYALMNAAAFYLRLVGHERAPCEVEVVPEETTASWQLLTAMPKAQEFSQQSGYGHYQAENFHDLIGYPMVWTLFYQECQFVVGGKTYYLTAFGAKDLFEGKNIKQIAADLKPVCHEKHQVFGIEDNRPYHFMLLVRDLMYARGGGLEQPHCNMSLIDFRCLPDANADNLDSENYRALITLLSHESFHTPLVTQIQPPEFRQSELVSPVDTSSLWLYEGATSLYEYWLMRRAGVISVPAFLDTMAKDISRLLRTPGELRTSLEEAAATAWVGLYASGPFERTSVSYYVKGAFFVLWLDYAIRKGSAHKHGFDHVLRHFYQAYTLQGEALPNEHIQSAVEGFAGEALTDIFARGLGSAQSLPIADILENYGIKMQVRRQACLSDTGGQRADANSTRPDLGVRIKSVIPGAPCPESPVSVLQVLPQSPAEKAHIMPGYTISHLGAEAVHLANYEKLLNTYAVGDKVWVHFTDVDNQAHRVEVVLEAYPENTCELSLIESISEETKPFRKALLSV